ncbi:MAG: hypothetical protein K8U03_18630, partial [Planctomycetia bacterium]|nr:hypothetical protein [Planctomycetia bacterium]
MMKRTYRRIRVTATLMAAASMLVPADANAFFGCLQKRQNAAASLYGGTVCNPCGQQLVCNYVPQTCYRTQTVAVPVTTYRPVCSADPCTGCPTTVMRPVVSYQQQVQYVPYSSYRLQYSVAQPACPTATTTYYAPAPTSGIGAPAMTYAAPAATYAAPAAGCSSCNRGVATTSYYAPAATYPAPTYPAPTYPTSTFPTSPYPTTTNYAAPRTSSFVPGTTNAYTYPPAQGNVNVSGYNYGAAAAPAAAPAATYGAPSSIAPTYAAPAYSAPSYSTQTYAPTYAAPSVATPAYARPTLSTPVPSLNGTSLNGTTLSSAAPLPTTGSVYYAPNSNSGSVSAGGLTPVPPTLNSSTPIPTSQPVPTTTYSAPALSAPMLTAPALTAPALNMPGTISTPAKSPYSSGVAPSGTAIPAAPRLQPIPDPELDRGPRMGPTSTPALIDPEDKTAMAWPVHRAWDYRVVGKVVPASLTTVVEQPAAVPPQATFQQPHDIAAVNPARLGAPQ